MKKVLLASIALSSLCFASAELYKKECASCHGNNGEKKALGKSEVIAGWSEDNILSALKGYKDGTRNVHGMIAVKKPIASKLSDDDMKSLASYISKL